MSVIVAFPCLCLLLFFLDHMSERGSDVLVGERKGILSWELRWSLLVNIKVVIISKCESGFGIKVVITSENEGGNY